MENNFPHLVSDYKHNNTFSDNTLSHEIAHESVYVGKHTRNAYANTCSSSYSSTSPCLQSNARDCCRDLSNNNNLCYRSHIVTCDSCDFCPRYCKNVNSVVAVTNKLIVDSPEGFNDPSSSDSVISMQVPVNTYGSSPLPVTVPTRGWCCYGVDRSNTPSLAADIDTTKSVFSGDVIPTVPLSASDVFRTTTVHSTQRRPMLSIKVLGLRGLALIDTAAKCSVAGYMLYKIFKEKGLTFGSKQVNVKLADGVVHSREVLVANVDVDISVDKSVRVDFVVFPEADNNDTLLGIDFLNAAGMVIDFSASSWHFSGCTRTYPLEYEGESILPRHPISVSSVSLRDDEGLLLTCDQRQQLADLLQHHEDIFRPGGEATRFAEHHIDTGSHAPIAVPPYRLTPAKRTAMEAEINKMLSDGIIEECESAWAAPALLVPKKDGTYRFCVDYRRLNAVTKGDTYPLPVIEDLLHATRREGYMSTIDLRSGYWQVSVSPADRDKTAFVSPFGTYRFTRMPFGLKNAPATFQRLMDRFRSGSTLKNTTLLVYLDDLLILSDGDFQKHLEDLESVFNRLRIFGLRANRDKCNFACNQVKYLGHLITPKGIMPDESKVQAIQQMNEPTNLKHLKSFLQTCSWFRKFVPGFSEIAQPLTKLTKKNEPWSWSEDRVEEQQDRRKEYADSSRRPSPVFKVGDQVLLTTHSLSNAPKGLTRKFMPQRDGPYIIKKVISSTTYELVDGQAQPIGRYHVSDLTGLVNNGFEAIEPVQPRRQRGRPPKAARKARS
ncbi:uncharacterized protein LOC119189485 [Manduca sexta]|uniref:uncharacterized protein LOC119189485 n=1 Tax=Manduca sexta TaxID=7130 RepID=UPI00188E7343|nr:uncharacterized protein LOC119189485 [Manduca sexta]